MALACLVATAASRGPAPRAPATSPAAGYTFTTVDVPHAAATTVYGINSAGVIVGEVSDSSRTLRGFVRTAAGATTTFAVAGSPSTSAFGINDAGVVVGAYSDSGDPISARGHGFVRWPDGASASFDAPAASTTYAYGIDATGRIAGYAFAPDAERGFISAAGDHRPRGAGADHPHATFAGPFTSITVPGSGRTTLYAVNAAGTAVGTYEPGTVDTLHGFVRSANGRMTWLPRHGVPDHTQPRAINTAGVVVGLFIDDRGLSGFVRRPDGAFERVDVPGARATSVYGVNDAGVLVGGYTDAAGHEHGFIATPVGGRP